MIPRIPDATPNEWLTLFIDSLQRAQTPDWHHVSDTAIQKAVKDAVHPELIAVDLKEAIFSLSLIVGRSASDDILDKIFENFCIGK